MGNKAYIILLGGVLSAVVIFLSSVAQLLPGFLTPFVAILFGLQILYITR